MPAESKRLHRPFPADTVDLVSVATEELQSYKPHSLCCKRLGLLRFPRCFSYSSTDNGIFLYAMRAHRTFQQIKAKFIQHLIIFRWLIWLKLILQRKYLERKEEIEEESYTVISYCRALDVNSSPFRTSPGKELLRASGRRLKSHPERRFQHWSQSKEKNAVS